jgi:hypothetical protein
MDGFVFRFRSIMPVQPLVTVPGWTYGIESSRGFAPPTLHRIPVFLVWQSFQLSSVISNLFANYANRCWRTQAIPSCAFLSCLYTDKMAQVFTWTRSFSSHKQSGLMVWHSQIHHQSLRLIWTLPTRLPQYRLRNTSPRLFPRWRCPRTSNHRYLFSQPRLPSHSFLGF